MSVRLANFTTLISFSFDLEGLVMKQYLSFLNDKEKGTFINHSENSYET